MSLRLETPTGAIDGVNRVFTVGQAYTALSARHVLNGQWVAPEGDDGLLETNPDGGVVTLKIAPLTGDQIWIVYDDGQSFQPVLRITVRLTVRQFEVTAFSTVAMPMLDDPPRAPGPLAPIPMTVGDTMPVLEFAFETEDGTAYSLVNHKVRLQLWWRGELEALVNTLDANQLMSITSPSGGLAQFTIYDQSGDSFLTRQGVLLGLVQIQLPDDRIQTVARDIPFLVRLAAPR